MTRRVALAAIGVALAGGFVLRPPAAWACVCVATTSQQQLKRADAVFTARVAGRAVGEDQTVVTLAVEAVYKGTIDRSQELRLVGGSRLQDDCTPELVDGRRYAIFADEHEGALTTNICSGTTKDVAAVTGALGQPIRTYPVAAPPPRGGAGANRSGAIAAAALVAAAGLAGAFAAWRARRPGARLPPGGG